MENPQSRHMPNYYMLSNICDYEQCKLAYFIPPSRLGYPSTLLCEESNHLRIATVAMSSPRKKVDAKVVGDDNITLTRKTYVT